MTRTLVGFVRWVVRHPRWVLGACLVLLGLSVWVSVARLRISSDQNELFDPKVKFFGDYLNFTRQFPEHEATYVLVEASPGSDSGAINTGRWTAIAEDLTARLRSMPEFVSSVDSRVPIDRLGDQGLLFDSPERVRQAREEVEQFIPLVRLWGEAPNLLERVLGPNPTERFLAGVNTQQPDEQTRAFLALLGRSWNAALERRDLPLAQVLPDLQELDTTPPTPDRLGYYFVPDETDKSKRVLLVRVYDRTVRDSLTATTRTIGTIRSAVAEVAAKYPEFEVNLTGRPVLEADEMETTDRDSHRAEVVAMIAVFIGLLWFLRSLRLALAGELALATGIGWTFGYTTLAVGNLNLLSIVFLLALIGIGMDYLVQILTRYRAERALSDDPEEVWGRVFEQVAAPINTACIGAAGAFLVSVLTPFKGAADLGVIAGGGLLLCLISGYTFLPSLLTLFPGKSGVSTKDTNSIKQEQASPEGNSLFPASTTSSLSFIRILRGPLPVFLLVLLALSPFLLRTRFDPGLIELQSPQLKSVQLVRKLQTWSIAVLSRDLDTLRRVRAAVQDLPVVASTESLLGAQDNLVWLKSRPLPEIRWAAPAPVEPARLDDLARKTRAAGERFRVPELTRLADQLESIPATAREAAALRLSDWQQGFVNRLRDTLSQFNPAALRPELLPNELRSHFIGTDGTLVLHVYPREDLWNQTHLAAFVTAVESATQTIPGDFTVTGIAPNIYHSTSSIRDSFWKATVYALVLIFTLVLLDLRNLKETLLAFSVLALGLPLLFAVMGLLGVSWNFANFFALPILIGAGHEYGVFLVHRYKEKRPWNSSHFLRDTADRALLLCGYITTCAFGFFFLLASHRGLKSLGLVMALGTVCIYLAAVCVLRPVLLRLRGKSPS